MDMQAAGWGLGRLPAAPLRQLWGGNHRSERAWTVANPKGTQRLPLLLLGERSTGTAKAGPVQMPRKSIKPVTGQRSASHSFPPHGVALASELRNVTSVPVK